MVRFIAHLKLTTLMHEDGRQHRSRLGAYPNDEIVWEVSLLGANRRILCLSPKWFYLPSLVCIASTLHWVRGGTVKQQMPCCILQSTGNSIFCTSLFAIGTQSKHCLLFPWSNCCTMSLGGTEPEHCCGTASNHGLLVLGHLCWQNVASLLLSALLCG